MRHPVQKTEEPCEVPGERSNLRYSWKPRSAPQEPAVFNAAICFDTKRGYCISGGGFSRWSVATNKTHTWDGARWQESEGIWPVECLAESAMAYDSKRGVAVMFSGAAYNSPPLDYTWERGDWGWVNRAGGDDVRPPARRGHCMAFDEKRGVTVLFGGTAYGQPPMHDVWEWDGSSWRCIEAQQDAAVPAPLGGAMAYDPVHERCVLYGGKPSADGLHSDTWIWDGATWREEKCAVTPGKRFWFAMAYDGNRKSIVLVGESENSEPGDKTWEFKGSNWQRIECRGPTHDLQHHGLAFDSRRMKLVLHGGEKRGHGRGDTWEFDGKIWRDETSVCTPQPDGETALFYDSRRKCAYLMGVDWGDYIGGTAARRMWIWAGGQWKPVDCKHMPPNGTPVVAFDDKRAIAVCLICTGEAEQRYLEVWEFDGTDWRQANRTPLQQESDDLVLSWNTIEDAFYDPYWGEVFANFCPRTESFERGKGLFHSWNGKRWVKRTRFEYLPHMNYGIHAYDPVRRRLTRLDLSEEGYRSYEFNWQAWSECTTAQGPTLGLGGRTLCMNSATGRVLCFGCGMSTGEQFSFDYHWEWDGANWTQPQLLLKPSPRSYPLMCYDKDRRSILLFGGHGDGAQLFDTWEYGPDD